MIRNTFIDIVLFVLFLFLVGCATTVKDLSPTARVYAMAKDYEVMQDLAIQYLRLPSCGGEGVIGACRTQAVAEQIAALDSEMRTGIQLARQAALASEEACAAPENETDEERRAREATCDNALVIAANAAAAARVLLNKLAVLLLQPEAYNEVTNGYQTTYLEGDGDRSPYDRWLALAYYSGASCVGQVSSQSGLARAAGYRETWAISGRVGGGRDPTRREGQAYRGAREGGAVTIGVRI